MINRISLPLLFATCLLTFTGCGLLGPSVSDTVTRAVVVGDANAISISAFNGSIKVRQGAGNEIEVIAKRTAQGNSEQDAQSNLEQLKVEAINEGGTIVVRTQKPTNFRGGIAFDVTIPAGMRIDAKTFNGSINVEADGIVLAESSNASIVIRGAAEQVNARTSNGSIDVDLTSAASVDLKTSNASVNLKGSLVAGKHRLSTSNGSVNVTVRDTPVYVSAKTSNGKIRLGDVTGKKDAEALLGNAEISEAELEIRTSNASVNVEYVGEPKQDVLVL